jgi:hypothetical protein
MGFCTLQTEAGGLTGMNPLSGFPVLRPGEGPSGQSVGCVWTHLRLKELSQMNFERAEMLTREKVPTIYLM